MPAEKLIALTPGKGLDSGVSPSSEDAGSGTTWRTCTNIWFREMALEHALGRTKILPTLGRSSQAMANTFTQAGKKRLYWEDSGLIQYWEGATSLLVGSLDGAGDYGLQPWGDWLLATDSINPLKIWQNTGTFFNIADAQTQFSRCRFVKKMAQHILAFATDVLPQGFHWCSADDPLTWTPALTNSARNLSIRNADSDIVAVQELGANLAVYFRDYMLLVQYVGPTDWFGTPTQAIQGAGAVSRHSVISLGGYNFGICRDGIFTTDGTNATFIDRPAVDKFVQEQIDWSRQSTIVGYWDARLNLAVWSVPLLTGLRTSIAMDPKIRTVSAESLYLSRKTYTFLDAQMTAALEREVFDQPIIGTPDGIYYASVSGSVVGNYDLTTQLLDGGSQEIFKSWDYAILTGAFGTGQMRFGFTDVPDFSTVQWNPWQTLATRVPLVNGPRESVYVALEFQGVDTFKISSVSVYGEKAGNVN